eukprot:TRINITY_DN4951_c0_g2_i2.p1 TRINITY_DN4951_c0_g2~~TRINITY_DN4951_c0_g2_i2.p1  ORF type:complete len:264 (-),score=27.46 TRINITY_DN4951_c0_g2_i2:159-950(-)
MACVGGDDCASETPLFPGVARAVESAWFSWGSTCGLVAGGLWAGITAGFAEEHTELASYLAGTGMFLVWAMMWEVLARILAHLPDPVDYLASLWGVLDLVAATSGMVLLVWGTADVHTSSNADEVEWTNARWRWLGLPLTIRMLRCYRCASRSTVLPTPLMLLERSAELSIPPVLWTVVVVLVPVYVLACVGVLAFRDSTDAEHWDTLAKAGLHVATIVCGGSWWAPMQRDTTGPGTASSSSSGLYYAAVVMVTSSRCAGVDL